MIRKQRGSQPQISLLAFQDIITSVSAVLILVVLLLALELTRQSGTSPLQEKFSAAAGELQTQIVSLTNEEAELATELEAARETVQLAIENPGSELGKAVSKAETGVTLLNEQLESLEDVSEGLDQEEQALAESTDEADDVRSRLAETLVQIEEQQALLDDLAHGKAARYAAPRGIEPEKGWLCDVADGALVLMSLSESPRRSVIRGDTADFEAVGPLYTSLRGWAAATTPAPQYVLFLIRPAGAGFGQSLVEPGNDLPFEFGIELIAADQQILN
ncbi:hypothetical protein Mal4_35510 [Maioricimonas rarisocia]|uniref:Uncharacterized protein n=1 Tax=Maioricimonas rarisocia TaxID=2528026 RepID=A0A517Z9Q0_9PLAN|nr:hypothetical protein [Maioricimonas rarisocia]QDU39214.1 hypothetical protein Mal4_35510 [Maioricimonas rarisocia]